MSVENGKVCCSCRHKICKKEIVLRTEMINCYCDIDGKYLSYAEVMTKRCRHWSKDKAGDTDENS